MLFDFHYYQKAIKETEKLLSTRVYSGFLDMVVRSLALRVLGITHSLSLDLQRPHDNLTNSFKAYVTDHRRQ